MESWPLDEMKKFTYQEECDILDKDEKDNSQLWYKSMSRSSTCPLAKSSLGITDTRRGWLGTFLADAILETLAKHVYGLDKFHCEIKDDDSRDGWCPRTYFTDWNHDSKIGMVDIIMEHADEIIEDLFPYSEERFDKKYPNPK